MPSYKTHAIHGEKILPEIDKKTEIKKDDLKAFCLGPDALIATDSQVFNIQHRANTRDFFITLMNLIKEKKLYDNSETMAFLYGQLDHFVLDFVTHPLIYYMTEGIKKEHIIDAHGLVEHYIDDYIVDKYNVGNGVCYHKVGISNINLIKLVNELYKKVYQAKNVGIKYSNGILVTRLYDTVLRRDIAHVSDKLIKLVNLGDVRYHDNYELARPFLNLEHDNWYNPETGEECMLSFDDLYLKACEIALEMIQDANRYIYQDKPLNNKIILNNTSYNTGLPCEKGQSKIYIKKY